MRVHQYRLVVLVFALLFSSGLLVGAEEEGAGEPAETKEKVEQLIEEEIRKVEEIVKEKTEKKVYYDDIVKIGANLTVDEDEVVKGDAVCIGGSMRIAGKVRGDAVCVGGAMRLDSAAVIEGDAVAVGGSIDRHEDAVVEGESISIGMPILPGLLGVSLSPRVHHVARAAASPLPVLFGLFLLVLVIAVLISAFLPTPTGRLETTVKRSFWKSFLVGLLAEVLMLPLFVFLAISIVGLALIPLAIIAVAAALYFGKTGVSLLVGNMFFSRFKSRLPHVVGSTAMGVVLTHSLWIVGGIIAYGVGALGGVVVALGSLVLWVAWTTGLGAVILTRFGSRLPADLRLEPESGGGPLERA